MAFCRNCGRSMAEDAAFCQACGQPTATSSQPHSASSSRATGTVSPWWWLLPIFFAVLGGAVSYLAAREVNGKTARWMLILGLIMTPVLALLILIFGVAMLTALTTPVVA